MHSKDKRRAKPEATTGRDPIELERRRLAIVLGDDTGFRLYLATYNEPRRRDDLIARLAGDLAKHGVSVTRLDVSAFGSDSSLAELLRRHSEQETAGGPRRLAVMVVGIEDLLDCAPPGKAFGFLERANIQREALPKAAPFPVVLWLTPRFSAVLPKVATDLWHWRAASFEFTGGTAQRVDVLRELARLPDERRRRLRTAETAERAELLEELLGELDRAGPPSTRREIAERVTLLDELGTSLLDLGRGSDARAVFEREIELATENRDAPALAAALTNLGDAVTYLGNLSRAASSYQAALEIRESLSARDPGNAGWQRDLSVSFNDIGDVQSAKGDLGGALKAYQDSLAIREKLAAQDPGNAEWQRDLSVSFNKIGDVQSAKGDLDGALKAYQDSLAIAQKLAAQDPGNAGWQRDLSVSFNKIGDVQSAKGDLDGALKAYQDSLAIAQKLAAQDPGNAGWQRDLSVSFNRIGDVQSAKGDLDGALKAYQDSLAIRQKLAAQDPGNAGWQRDLSVSFNRIGDVQSAKGDLDGALKAYQDSLAIAQKLAAQDPGNAELAARPLGQLRQDRRRAAREGRSRRRAQGLPGQPRHPQKLAAQDPGNAGWQRDLIVSNVKLAEVAEAQDGQASEAARHYRAALDIAVALRDSGRLAPVDAWMVGELEARLERVSAQAGPQ